MKLRNKLGLCLSGGGARGFAHIGVIKALEEREIYPTVVSGTSMGAVIGLLYAAGKTSKEMYELASATSISKMINKKLTVPALGSLRYLESVLRKELGNPEFSDLKHEFSVCVSNLNTGEFEIIKSGEAIPWVIASASIPLLFRTVEMKKQIYVDGGLLNNFPIEAFNSNTEYTIGVNVNPHGEVQNDMLDEVLEVGERCFELLIWNNTKERVKHCDLLIEPLSNTNFHLFDFKKIELLVELGYRHGRKALDSFQLLAKEGKYD